MVTVVPPLAVLLFAGPIRTSREIVESFEIGIFFLYIKSAFY